MKTQNNNQLLPKVLLAILSASLFACAAKPQPEAEIYSNEPMMVTHDNYNLPPSMDDANTVESSGITAPIEETSFTEPPVEEMNNVTPPMHEPVAEEMAMQDSMTTETAAANTTNLNEIPADYFAVQVVASSTLRNLNAFATQHDLSNDLTTQVTVGNKTWNVLLLGTYSTLAAAKEALVSIQDKVNTSPWIRRVGSLQ